MSVHIDTSEVRALASTLASAGPRVGAQAAKAVRKTAYDIEADAKALAPVDTGALRSSISTTISGDGRFGSMTAEVGPTVEYGIYQEFGTSTQPGTSFMGPAFDRRAPGLEAALAQLGGQAALG